LEAQEDKEPDKVAAKIASKIILLILGKFYNLIKN